MPPPASKAAAPRKRFTKRSIIAFVLVLALVAGLAWDGSPLGSLILRKAVALKFRDVRQVSPEELVAWMKDPNRPPPLLIDARPSEQFVVSHIDGAVNIDPAAPDMAPLAHVSRDQPVLVYDGPGVMGAAMVVGLQNAEFTRVSNLDGGLFRWTNEGNPIVTGSGPVARVHPINGWWGRLLKGRYRP
jgi:rhodanese-related sulfurtransferase